MLLTKAEREQRINDFLSRKFKELDIDDDEFELSTGLLGSSKPRS
jgi:hypothetical protein